MQATQDLLVVPQESLRRFCRVQQRRQKFYIYQAASTSIDFQFVASFRKQKQRFISSLVTREMIQSARTRRAGSQLLLRSRSLVVYKQHRADCVGSLIVSNRTHLTSTSLFFSLFRPTELLPLLAVSRAGITEIWWRGILAGLQVAKP